MRPATGAVAAVVMAAAAGVVLMAWVWLSAHMGGAALMSAAAAALTLGAAPVMVVGGVPAAVEAEAAAAALWAAFLGLRVWAVPPALVAAGNGTRTWVGGSASVIRSRLRRYSTRAAQDFTSRFGPRQSGRLRTGNSRS